MRFGCVRGALTIANFRVANATHEYARFRFSCTCLRTHARATKSAERRRKKSRCAKIIRKYMCQGHIASSFFCCCCFFNFSFFLFSLTFVSLASPLVSVLTLYARERFGCRLRCELSFVSLCAYFRVSRAQFASCASGDRGLHSIAPRRPTAVSEGRQFSGKFHFPIT